MTAAIKQLLQKPFVRYVLVGGTAFVVEYSVFYGLFYGVHLRLGVANAISFGMGLLTSYLLNRLWTFFKHTYKHKAHRQFGLYVGLALFNLLATLLLVRYFTSLSIAPSIGKLMAMAITSAWNFIIFKRVIFKHDHAEAD